MPICETEVMKSILNPDMVYLLLQLRMTAEVPASFLPSLSYFIINLNQRVLVKINPVPASISDEELQVNICKALSLTGHEVKPDNLQACYGKI